MALPQGLRNLENRSIPTVSEEDVETVEGGFYELTDEELLALIDRDAREGLGISGEEYLRGLKERTIPRTGPNGYLAHLSMLASLLDY
ncbi:MAG: hypothetical protein FJ147_24035 [Deltaproteobacteria bacterium]|nr:hypothetical protein [Deltaproteobacteria bacterium]